MKKIIFLFVLISNIFLSAQNMSIFYNSSVTNENNMYIRTKSVPNLNNINIQTKSPNGWEISNFTPYFNNTLQTVIDYQSNLDSLQYLLYSDSLDIPPELILPDYMGYFEDVTLSMASIPKINSQNPTVADLGIIGTDPSDDIENSLSNNLDIKRTYSGFTEQSLIIGIENGTNSFPFNEGITGPFYAYLVLFKNMTSTTNSIYAMVYANITATLQTGLYEISNFEENNPFDSINRIGDINSEIVNGKLLLSCDWETLYELEDWSEDTQNFFLISLTAKMTILNGMILADKSVGTVTSLEQNYFYNPTNSLPTISSPQIFNSNYLRVNYNDPENHIPIFSEYISQGTSYPLYSSIDFVNGEIQLVSNSPISPNHSSGIIKTTDNNSNWVELNVTLTSNDNVINVLPKVSIYPNPFKIDNNRNLLSFKIHSDLEAETSIKIYNILGKKIKNFNKKLKKGENIIHWNLKDNSNKIIPAGLYFSRIKQNNQILTSKILIIK